MAKGKKIALKITLWVLSIMFFLLITPVILLNINSVQNFVVQKITHSLSETLNTEVKVGYVDLRGFNRLKINDLYIADLAGDTLINIENVEGKFSILKLLKKQVVIHSVILERADIHLVKDTTGALNADFLKVLFEKKDDKPQKTKFTFEIDDILLKNSTFSFRNLQKKTDNSQKTINFDDIYLKDINSRISLYKIAENYFSGSVKSLSFSEKSGFKLKDFQTTFLLNDSTCKVTKTKLLLPNSQILLDSIVLIYNNLETFKTNFEKTQIDAGMFSAKISGKDLTPFSPIFSGLKNEFTARLRAYGTIENLIIERLDVNYGKEIGFAGACQATGLPDLAHTYVLATIDDLHGSAPSIQDLVAGILHKPFVLPKPLQNLKKLSYKGKISGYVGNLALLGTLNSSVGSIKTDLAIRTNSKFENVIIEGNVKTSGLDLAAITPSASGLGKIAVDADATIKTGKNVPFESKINAKIPSFVFRDYNYNNLIINGNIAKNTFEGNASIDDKNGQVDFHGKVDWEKDNRNFHFNANVRNFAPNKLNLIKSYPNLELNFGLNADFEGDEIEKIKGNIDFSHISIINNGVFSFKKFNISSKPQNDTLNTIIESDLLNGYLSGNYSLATFPADFMNTLSGYMPILKEKYAQNADNKNFKKNNFGFYFEIEPLKSICDVLEISWATTKKSTISGFYNSDIKRFNAEIDVPQLTRNSAVFNGTNFRCSNDEKKIILYASTLSKTKNDSLSISFKADFADDFSNILAQWNNFNEKSIQAGELYMKTQIFKENDSLMLSFDILPTQIVIKNNVLDIKKSNILTNFNYIDIHNFSVSGGNQNVFINGRASKSEDDKIFVTLENFNLDFVNNFISAGSPLSFGGSVSGNAEVARVFRQPILDAKLKVPDFIFNNALMGAADVSSTFDYERNCLVFNGIVNYDKKDTTAILDGAFFFKNDSLDLKGDARRLNLGFLKPITKNIFDNVGGFGSGNVHITTRKGRTLVETAAKVDDGHLKIGFLNADFYFNDSIILTKDSILFKKIDIFDAEKNKGLIDGYVAHKYLKNFNYKLTLQANKMLLFNAKKGGKSSFYGKAYGTGSGAIFGNQEQTNITCNLTTEPNTKITIPLDGASAAASSDFITFVSSKDTLAAQPKIDKKIDDDDKSNIVFDMTLNANTNAEIQLFLDSRAGDMLRVAGDGNLQIKYNGKTDDFTMFGRYDLLEGKYLFTFQEVLRKEFKITNGSSLQFSGAPSNPTVDIKAVYQTEAPLTSIFDETILTMTNRKKALVNCLLNITGNLLHPVISFDLNLPNSDEELNRALKNIVNTDEMMNREIVYLLALGYFYKPDYMQTNASTTQSEVLNVVASTLSQQLNTMASQLFDKWNFGVNFNIDNTNAATEKNNEYTMNFAYAPNDKLVINGNVGYQDGKTQNQEGTAASANNYILDFEIEYKLVQSGKLNARAYNRTNTYNEIKSAPYTQGIGLVYRENFNSIKELVANWRKNRKKKLKTKS